MSKDTRGQRLEELLTVAFNNLQEAEQITEEKIDIPFLLNIVGSYITAMKEGKLAEDVLTPADLFTERVLPIVDNSELEVEEIEDGTDASDEVVGGDVS